MAKKKYDTGRPTAYNPDFCQIAIDFLAQGYSRTALAGHLGVTRQTVYNWSKDHPEFFDALSLGEAKTSLFWESRLIDIARGGDGNTSATIFALKNRVSAEWRDAQHQVHEDPDGRARGVSAVEKLNEHLTKLAAKPG